MNTTTLRQLDIFAQLVASGNIVDCARALGVSPALVETNLHSLEERLGHRLFAVDGPNVRLTPVGRKTIEAMAVLSGVDSAVAEEPPAPEPSPEPAEPAIVQEVLPPLEPPPAEETEPPPAVAEEPPPTAPESITIVDPPAAVPQKPLRPLDVRVAFRTPGSAPVAPRPQPVSFRPLTSPGFEPAFFPQPDPEEEEANLDEPILELDSPIDDPRPFAGADKRQQVTVAAHPSIFGHFQDALAAFEQANPDVAIALDLHVFTAVRAEPLLATGGADIAYYYAMGDPDRLDSRYVWSEQLSLYIGGEHPLASAEGITAEDLLNVRPALLGASNGLRPILDDAQRRSGLDLWQPAIETDNLPEIAAAVRRGRAYFAAFGPLARDFAKEEGIRRLPFSGPLPTIEVRQAVRPEMRDDPVVASLAEYLFR